MSEDQKRKYLIEKFSPYSLVYLVTTAFVFFIFPHELMGNIYVLSGYFIMCLIFIYIFFKYKKNLD